MSPIGWLRSGEYAVNMTIFITCGTGYIGSHMVHSLVDAGERVTVLDNLSTIAMTNGCLWVKQSAFAHCSHATNASENACSPALPFSMAMRAR